MMERLGLRCGDCNAHTWTLYARSQFTINRQIADSHTVAFSPEPTPLFFFIQWTSSTCKRIDASIRSRPKESCLYQGRICPHGLSPRLRFLESVQQDVSQNNTFRSNSVELKLYWTKKGDYIPVCISTTVWPRVEALLPTQLWKCMFSCIKTETVWCGIFWWHICACCESRLPQSKYLNIPVCILF